MKRDGSEIENKRKKRQKIDKSVEIGRTQEKKCEEYLINNNIPYKRNVIFRKNKIDMCELDFIIPGHVLEVKQWNVTTEEKKDTFIKQCHKQIINIQLYVPNDYSIYILMELVKDVSEYQNIFSEYKNVKVINTLDVISYVPYPYFVSDTNILRYVVSLHNPTFDKILSKFQNKITTTQLVYNMTSSSLIDKEQERLDLLHLNLIEDNIETLKFIQTPNLEPKSKFIDKKGRPKYSKLNLVFKEIKKRLLQNSKIPIKRIELTCEDRYNVQCKYSYPFDEKIFNVFYIFCTNRCKLSANSPQKVISGLSFLCTKCNKIILDKWKRENNICICCL